MRIELESIQLVTVHNACQNALRSSNGIQGRTRMTLDNITDTIKPRRESFQKHWEEEIKRCVVHEDGVPLEKGNSYVFKSDKLEEEYMEYVELLHEVDIDLLGKEELRNIITTTDQYGTADDHYRSLKLVTKGFAEPVEGEENKRPESD